MWKPMPITTRPLLAETKGLLLGNIPRYFPLYGVENRRLTATMPSLVKKGKRVHDSTTIEACSKYKTNKTTNRRADKTKEIGKNSAIPSRKGAVPDTPAQQPKSASTAYTSRCHYSRAGLTAPYPLPHQKHINTLNAVIHMEEDRLTSSP